MENKQYYNKVYANSDKYNCHYSKSVYFPIWQQILNRIKDEKIFEIGCGTGQFARMLLDFGKNYITGIDYSETAIEIAKKTNPRNKDKFEVYDIFNIYIGSYDLFLCLEVLEHIRNDKKLLKKIPQGKKVIMSVPNFWDQAHVRVFRDKGKIIRRYQKLVDITEITENQTSKTGKIFVVYGIRK